MPSILGNAIVIVVLLVVIFFSGRKTIRDLKAEMSGKGCSGCAGCKGCSSGACAACCKSSPKTGKEK